MIPLVAQMVVWLPGIPRGFQGPAFQVFRERGWGDFTWPGRCVFFPVAGGFPGASGRGLWEIISGEHGFSL